MALPPLTPEQRAAALEKAALARKARAELKVRLKSSGTSLADVLASGETDEAIGKMKVVAVLESLPGVGKVRAQRLMEKLEISPAEASVKVGDTVEWVNKDVLAHTATANNGDFNVMLPPNKSGSFTLKKAGTVAYYCRFHPNMKATLNIAP